LPDNLTEIKKFVFKMILVTILFCGIVLFGGLTYFINGHRFSCNMLNSGQYIYQELGTERLVTFEMLSGYLTNGHRVERLFICSNDFKYRCAIGDRNGFVFAVPRKLYINTIKWNFNNLKFNFTEKNTYILGTFVYGIELIDKDRTEKFWYYYSPWRGILAFGITNKEKGTNLTYLTQSTCGILSE